MATILESQVLDALRRVVEPDLKKDIVTLNMVQDVQISGGDIGFTVILTNPAGTSKDYIEGEAVAAVKDISGVSNVTVNFDRRVPADPRLMSKLDIGVRNAIAVASGKGGVGKSTMATNLAVSLALDGASIGLLDADIYGPNIPVMMGVDARPKATGGKIQPPENYGLKMFSMGFLVDPKQPLIWRGPMLHSAVRQFLQDVQWGDLDYLVIDLPPGTGDASLSLAQSMSLSGAVIVTTPQKVATTDVIRSFGMFEQLNVPVLGVVENMSYFVAPDTGNRYDIFGQGGGQSMAEEMGAPFLGQIPLEPAVREGGDAGVPIVKGDPESAAAQAIRGLARTVASAITVQNLAQDAQPSTAKGPNISIVG